MNSSAQHPLIRRWLAAALAASLTLGGVVGLGAPAYADESTEPGVVEVVETPAVEAPAAEAPAETPAEAPAEETPAETPADETPADETPSEEAPAEEAPTEGEADERASVKEAPAEDAPADDFVQSLAVVTPTVIVSPSSGIDTTVANTITITGSNFVGDGAASGVYVLLGPADKWTGDGALPGTGWTALGWVRANQIVEGAFTTTLTVAAGVLDPSVSYVVATSAAHALSATNRTMDTFTDLTLKPAVIPPAVVVSPVDDIDTTVANTFTIAGSNFVGDGAASGVYVLLGPADKWTGDGALPGTGWTALGWVRANQIVDGAFTTTLTVAAGVLDPSVSYVVATSAAHALSATNRTMDTFTALSLKPAVVPPAVVVSPVDNIDTTIANTFTITGSNFVGDGAASGVYVLLGPADKWTGEGALPGTGWTALGWVRATQIVDGAFSTTLTVAAGVLDPSVEYVVATSAAHALSATNRTMDTFTALSLKPAVVPPAVVVSPVDNIDTTIANTFTITGSNFVGDGAASGVYVLLGPADKWTGEGALPGTGWTALGWVRATQIVDGAFSTTLTVAAGVLDPSVSYVVATSAAHALSATNRTMDTFTDLTLKPAVIPPAVVVSPVDNIDTTIANTFTITGSNFIGDGAASGVYVLLGPADKWTGDGALPGTGWTALGWVRATQIVDGAFTTTLTVAAGVLDPSVEYVVATSAAHALSATNRTMDTFTDLTLKPAVAAPSVVVTPNSAIDTTVSNTFTITGSNFAGDGAASGVYVLLGPASKWNGSGPLPDAGWTALGWVRATQLVDGAFTTTLTVAGGVLDPSVEYVVATSAAHALSATNRTLDTFTALSLKPATAAPKLTLSKSTGINPAGETITVSGTNLAGPDLYLQVGWIKPSTWAPSTGGANDVDRKGTAAQVVGSAVYATVPLTNGAFSTTFSITKAQLDAIALVGGQLAFYTVGAGGAVSASNEAYATFTFTPPTASTPTLTLSKSTGLNPAGETVTVTGANFAGPDLYLQAGWIKPSTWAPSTGGVNDVDRKGLAAQVIGSAVFATVPLANGSFTTQFTVTKAELDAIQLAGGQLVFYTVGAGGAVSASNEAYATFAFTASTTAPVLTLSKSTGLNPAGETVTVSGANLAGPDLYLQAGWIKPGTWAPSKGGVNDVDRKGLGAQVVGSAVYATVPLTNGSFTAEFTVTKAELDAITLAGGQLVFYTVGAGGAVSASNEAYAVFEFATTTTPTDPTEPTEPTNPTNPNPPTSGVSLSVSPGSVDASVANTFTISGSGYTGAGAANGVYVNIGASSVWQPGQVPAQGGWVVSAWVTPANVVNGSFTTTLTVPANTFVAGQSYGVATFAAHALSLTNRTLDKWAPISLGGASGTATAAVVTNTPAATPPATTGVKTTGQPQAGSSFTAEAEGYQPNEAGILVVIYSTPQVLGTVTADAQGVAKWTGILPAALTGKHTLTFQGSVDRGVELDIAPADVIGCAVDDATLTWGFKESFRSYISGSIANGEWTVANGATYETPSFGFAEGTGGYDAETSEGLVAFLGSITFTGHGGVLNTTVSNPQIRFESADTGYLLLDISGTTQEGKPITAASVEFAKLDLSGAEVVDGVWSVTDAQATLTADGAADFGTYPEGEALDPVSLTFTVAPDCASAGAVDPTATADPDLESTSSESGLGWLWWLLIALGVAAIVVVVVLMVRRRRSAE